MEEKTMDECLTEIFDKGSKSKKSTFKIWKFRHKKGILSLQTKLDILKRYSYVIVKEATFTKKPK